MFDTAVSLLPDDEALLQEQEVADNKEEVSAEMAELVRRTREFYTKLGQEIWPAGSRR